MEILADADMLVMNTRFRKLPDDQLKHITAFAESVTPLITGRAVKGAEPGGERFSDPHTIAWVHHYEGEKGKNRFATSTPSNPPASPGLLG